MGTIVQKKWKGKKGKLQTGYQAQVRMKGQFLSSTFDTRKKAKIWIEEQEMLIRKGYSISEGKKITVSDVEAEGIWQRGISYKGLPHYIKDAKDIEIDKLAAIQELPVQSCIVDIRQKDQSVTVKGFAWSGGGRGIIRVDISCDGGKTWNIASLKEGSDQKINKAWAWTFWEYNLTIQDKDKDKEIQFVCKATDSSYNSQPENKELAWNIRGLNNNSWHRVNWKST